MLVQRTRCAAKLLLGERDGEPNAARRDSAVGEALHGSKCDEITEAVEPFTPASAGQNEPQAFPIAKTARRDT
jgi:hypothetical protein